MISFVRWHGRMGPKSINEVGRACVDIPNYKVIAKLSYMCECDTIAVPYTRTICFILSKDILA